MFVIRMGWRNQSQGVNEQSVQLHGYELLICFESMEFYSKRQYVVGCTPNTMEFHLLIDWSQLSPLSQIPHHDCQHSLLKAPNGLIWSLIRQTNCKSCPNCSNMFAYHHRTCCHHQLWWYQDCNRQDFVWFFYLIESYWYHHQLPFSIPEYRIRV